MYVTSRSTRFSDYRNYFRMNIRAVSIPGFLEPKEIEPILKYFGEGAYKTKIIRYINQLLNQHGESHLRYYETVTAVSNSVFHRILDYNRGGFSSGPFF